MSLIFSTPEIKCLKMSFNVEFKRLYTHINVRVQMSKNAFQHHTSDTLIFFSGGVLKSKFHPIAEFRCL